MNWLARLKAENSSQTHATNATNTPNVAFVASISTTEPKTPEKANPSNAPCIALKKPEPLRHLQLQLPVNEQTFVLLDKVVDPDRWCWPHSPAMNTQEIGTFMARLEQFTNKGLRVSDAEMLGDKLVQRDREVDDRRLCLECIHLQGDMGRWRCANGIAAGVTVDTANAPLPRGMTQQLQRCPGSTSCASQKESIDEQ